jgi:hypothetical protein
VDYEFVVRYLTEALDLLQRYTAGGSWTEDAKTAEAEFDRRVHHIKATVKSVIPGLERQIGGFRYAGQPEMSRVALEQSIYAATEGAQVMRSLQPNELPSPQLRADALHPTVWDAAKSLWRSNHRRQAVEAAAIAVNAALQDRLSRRDVSNTALVREAFSRDAPAAGRPRLRLWPDDGSETYRSIHDGARDFGAGCYQALRNLASHEPVAELSEQIALEQLAAFSILSRWIDEATVAFADEE